MVAIQPVLSVLIGAELTPEVVGALVLGVLEVVLAVGRGLPHVEHSVGDGLASHQIADDTMHQTHTAFGSRVLDDGASVLAERGVGGPKGPQNGRRCGINARIRDDLVSDLVHEATDESAWIVSSCRFGHGYIKVDVVYYTYVSRPRMSEMRWASFLVLLDSA